MITLYKFFIIYFRDIKIFNDITAYFMQFHFFRQLQIIEIESIIREKKKK